MAIGAIDGATDDDMLVMTGIRKRYGDTIALDGASLRVARGSIHGLIGQNGAGKSTLLKILAGAETPDDGTIELAGEAVHLSSPADAHRPRNRHRLSGLQPAAEPLGGGEHLARARGDEASANRRRRRSRRSPAGR